jgi:hypothetical protein
MMWLQILVVSLGFSLTDLSPVTDLNGNRKLVAQCAEGDAVCLSSCEAGTCEVVLPPCLDCMSTNNNYVQVFLLTIGSYFTAGTELTQPEIAQYLQAAPLMVWSSKSIYNTSEYDGIFIRMRFDSLCPLEAVTKDALVLDHLDNNSKFSYKATKVAICFYEQLGLKAYNLNYKESN